jgi:hypothetical protein
MLGEEGQKEAADVEEDTKDDDKADDDDDIGDWEGFDDDDAPKKPAPISVPPPSTSLGAGLNNSGDHNKKLGERENSGDGKKDSKKDKKADKKADKKDKKDKKADKKAPAKATAAKDRPTSLTQIIYPALGKLVKPNNDQAVNQALSGLKNAFDAAEDAQAGLTHQLIAAIIETLKR